MTIGKYPIIYADPPWRYTQKGLQGAAEHHYPTMSIQNGGKAALGQSVPKSEDKEETV